MDAAFRHGAPVMVDYTPGAGDVNTGDVVLVGNQTGWTCGVAHGPIANTKLGAIAAGGGVYELNNRGNLANGAQAFWNLEGDGVVETDDVNTVQFGYVVSRGGDGDNTPCYVLHKPYVQA